MSVSLSKPEFINAQTADDNVLSSMGEPPITTAVTTITSMGASEVKTHSKIDLCELYDKIRPRVCMVEGSGKKATGFFLDAVGSLVSVFHILPLSNKTNGTFEVNCKSVSVTYKGKQYDVGFPAGFDANVAKKLDLCVLKINNLEGLSTPFFELLPNEINIREGMKAYFAGFPLTQTTLTFHKGSISSIFTQNSAQYFTVDGTVVPGNSGGPVITLYEGKPYLSGVIFAEVADLDPGFLFFEESFSAMRQAGGVGGMCLGLMYPDGIVRPTSPLDVVSIALTVVRRNMSTGIGKAIHARHINELSGIKIIPAALLGPMQVPCSDDLLVSGRQRNPIKITKNKVDYYAHHDGHGDKHLVTTKDPTHLKKKSILESTKSGPAKFYPDVINHTNYDAYVKQCVTTWIERTPIPDLNNRYIEAPSPVGADSGYETSVIEIYLSDSLGAHIRPKYLA